MITWTAFLCDSGMVPCWCQAKNDLGKGPEVCHTLDTKNKNWRDVL